MNAAAPESRPCRWPFYRWFELIFVDLAQQFRWSYLPPLMIYLAAGLSGLTAIAGTFFVKEHFGFSAAFLASLGFWAGIPWALKMPIGHVVDLIWRWKSILVYLGASLIAASIAIMYGLIAHTGWMAGLASIEFWYVTSAVLAPVGYVVQDVVADAMTVEAVPGHDERGRPLPEAQTRAMHTTMQTLGRVAILSGLIVVATLNIGLFTGVESMSDTAKAGLYSRIFLLALAIPAISIVGVTLGEIMLRVRTARMRQQGFDDDAVASMLKPGRAETRVNWWIFGGGLAFVLLTLAVGLGGFKQSQEIVFLVSMAIVLFLVHQLVNELPPADRGPLIGTAIILFVFRAVPLPGPGVTWWEIDILGFDQQFLSVLSLLTSLLALAGILILRPYIARKTIADVVLVLTAAGGILSLPNIGLYFELHEWTASWSNGIIDQRFIAILDTALESPLVQIAMIPMLAWIARHAPGHLKATFFAVMASFTNLALAASSLGTKYLNQLFVVEREVRDRATGLVVTPANYDEVGWLLIVTAAIGVLTPLLAILLVQISPLRTRQ